MKRFRNFISAVFFAVMCTGILGGFILAGYSFLYAVLYTIDHLSPPVAVLLVSSLFCCVGGFGYLLTKD